MSRSDTSIAHKTIASSGARGVVESQDDSSDPVFGKETIVLTPEKIFHLMDGLLEASRLHDHTGGTHSAALATVESLTAVREDIYRYNAIDMLGGYALLHGIDCADRIIYGWRR